MVKRQQKQRVAVDLSIPGDILPWQPRKPGGPIEDPVCGYCGREKPPDELVRFLRTDNFNVRVVLCGDCCKLLIKGMRKINGDGLPPMVD